MKAKDDSMNTKIFVFNDGDPYRIVVELIFEHGSWDVLTSYLEGLTPTGYARMESNFYSPDDMKAFEKCALAITQADVIYLVVPIRNVTFGECGEVFIPSRQPR